MSSIKSDLPELTNRITWWVIATMACTLAASYLAAGLSLDVSGAWPILLVIPACLSISLYYRYYRVDLYISVGAETSVQLMLIVLLGTLLSFVAATANLPYRDAALFQIDRWIGFDWKAYLDFFNTHYVIWRIIHVAYLSIHFQPLLVIAALVATRHFVRLQQFILATALALCITVAIFIFTPAVANYAYLGLQRSDFADLYPGCAFEHVRHLEALRNATTHIVRLSDLDGLIIFPSFHAVTAFLFAWALWPIRQLRWPAFTLNVLMIAGTPIDGAHYAVDIVGGCAIAILTILGVAYVPLLDRAWPRKISPAILDNRQLSSQA